MKNIGLFILTAWFATPSIAGDTVEEFIREYPHQEQVRMMNQWLENNTPGSFEYTGLVDPADDRIVTPQATADYGYNWFSISEGPAIITTPVYDYFFSISVFDMKHNVPAVIVNPEKPILIRRPGQKIPEGDFTVVTLETDQGLVLTRMVVIDNMQEVEALRSSISMEGGDGNMHRNVQRFSPEVEQAGLAVIAAATPILVPVVDNAFGMTSGDIGELTLAVGVMIGHLGTPNDSVRYSAIMVDENEEPFNGVDTYVMTIPAGIVKEDGYYSITAYGTDNKLLIKNEIGIYDRTTYSSKQNADGSYTVTLSPDGSGINGIPTGKPFYVILRAYVPVPNADLTVTIDKR